MKVYISKQTYESIQTSFFIRKTLGYQKKTLPLPRFLRNDNIMSNLLIKTNLVLTIKEWKI